VPVYATRKVPRRIPVAFTSMLFFLMVGCAAPFQLLGAGAKMVGDTTSGIAKSGVKLFDAAAEGASAAVKAAKKGNAPAPDLPEVAP